MKLKLSVISALLCFAMVVALGNISWAGEKSSSSAKNNKSIMAEKNRTDPMGRQSASEISKDKAEKEQQVKERKKRDAKKVKQLESLEKEYGKLSPAERFLVKELPLEVRVRLKNIPREGRLDWLIDRVVEGKSGKVKNFLMKDEEFSKQWDKTPKEDRKALMKKGLKKLALNMDKKQGQKKPADAQRKMLKKQPQGQGPGLNKERMKNLTPEKRREALRNAMKQNRGKNQPMMREQIKKNVKPGMKNKQPIAVMLDAKDKEALNKLPPEKRLDFIVDLVMEKHGDKVKEMINKNPDLKKKLDGLSPEKRKDAIRNFLKKKIAQKMKAMQGSQKNAQQGKKNVGKKGMMQRGQEGNRGENQRNQVEEKRGKMKQPRQQFNKQRSTDQFRNNMGNYSQRQRNSAALPAKPPQRKPSMNRPQIGKGNGMQNMPIMNPAMREKMIQYMMENPDVLAQIVKSFPPEFKRMLIGMLREDMKVEKKVERKVIIKDGKPKEKAKTGKKSPAKGKVLEKK